MKSSRAGKAGRSRAVVSALAAGYLALAPLHANSTSKDGIFPTADQVGGQVYPDPVKPGTPFPADIEVFDLAGKQVDLAKLIAGKKTVIAFFITAAPTSVDGVKKLQEFAQQNAPGVQVLGLNADTVGVALEGGPGKAVEATAKTLRVYQQERKLKNLFVAPNDALDPKSVSNRLGFRGLPTIFVIRPDGVIEKVYVGPQQWKKGDI